MPYSSIFICISFRVWGWEAPHVDCGCDSSYFSCHARTARCPTFLGACRVFRQWLTRLGRMRLKWRLRSFISDRLLTSKKDESDGVPRCLSRRRYVVWTCLIWGDVYRVTRHGFVLVSLVFGSGFVLQQRLVLRGLLSLTCTTARMVKSVIHIRKPFLVSKLVINVKYFIYSFFIFTLSQGSSQDSFRIFPRSL